MTVSRGIFRLFAYAVVIAATIVIAFHVAVTADRSSLEIIVVVGFSVMVLAKVVHLLVLLFRSFKFWREDDSVAVERVNVFCRGCGYALVGLVEARCPECGRGFDLSDSRTFSRRPGRGAVWKRGRWVIGVGLLLVLVVGLGVGWLWWGWHCEQKVIGQLRGADASQGSWRIVIRPIGSERLRLMFGTRFSYLLNRVTGVKLMGKGAGEIEGIDFKSLGNLEVLTLETCGLNEGACNKIGEGVTLREINLHGVEVKGDGLGAIARLPRLAKLELVGTDVNDRMIGGISELKGLKVLRIDCVEIPSGALLGKLTGLEEFSVAGSGMKESDIECVNGMRSLRRLDVRETRASSKQIAKLKRAVPELKVRSNFKNEW